ncbi:MAG: aminotransferase class IV [Oligoflexia bacterium]|nr:aminotransferase class IV [Oligoflexia bacterium]
MSNNQNNHLDQLNQFNPIISINGTITNKENAKISVLDRGLLFGDSIYEVLMAYDSVVFLLREHLDRLWNSAEGLFMNIPISKNELSHEIIKTIKAAGNKISYIRLMITRGEASRFGLDNDFCSKGNFIIIVQKHSGHSSHYYSEGVTLGFADVIRNDVRALNPKIKSGNYLNNFLAYMSVKNKEKGAYESIMLNSDGQVTECSTSNIWIIKNDKVFTPPTTVGILAGITRETILKLGKKIGMEIREENFGAKDVINADEAFISSTTRIIFPATKIVSDLRDQKIGSGVPGPMTMRLLAEYRKFINEYINRYRDNDL